MSRIVLRISVFRFSLVIILFLQSCRYIPVWLGWYLSCWCQTQQISKLGWGCVYILVVVSIASVIKSHGCVDSTMFSLVLTTTTDVSTVALGSHSALWFSMCSFHWKNFFSPIRVILLIFAAKCRVNQWWKLEILWINRKLNSDQFSPLNF